MKKKKRKQRIRNYTAVKKKGKIKERPVRRNVPPMAEHQKRSADDLKKRESQEKETLRVSLVFFCFAL